MSEEGKKPKGRKKGRGEREEGNGRDLCHGCKRARRERRGGGRKGGRQTDRQTGRQTDRQSDRQKDQHID